MHNSTFNPLSSWKQSWQLHNYANYDTWMPWISMCSPGKVYNIKGKQNLSQLSNQNSWEWLMLWHKWASPDRKLLPDWETPQQHHTETSSWRNVRKQTGSWTFLHKLLHGGNPAKENLRDCNTECVSTICLLVWLNKEEGTSLLKRWLISCWSLRNCVPGELTSGYYTH